MIRLDLALCCFLQAGTAAAAAGATHPFSVHDLQAMDRVVEHRVSPNGRSVAFVLRTTDFEANRGRTDLWAVAIDGTGARRLTTHEANDWNPVWAPDSDTIYFLSARSGASQVWRLSLSGGEAEAVTKLPLDVSTLAVSKDGRQLAVGMDVYVDCPSLQCTVDRLAENAKRKQTGRIYDHLFVRHWDTWSDGRRSHLFVLPVQGGEPVDVMKGMDADGPSKPFGGIEEFTFTPDGRGVVFTARDAGKGEAWSTNLDLFWSPIDGKSPATNLTAANPATDTSPCFSPDGKTLAYLAMARPGYEADRQQLMLMSWPEKKARSVAASWDRSAGDVTWSSDGKWLLATADNLGQRSLYAIDAATGEVKVLVQDGQVTGPQVAGSKVVFAKNDLSHPADLFALNLETTEVLRLTDVNHAKLATVRLGEAESFTFSGWNNETVHGYLVKPVDFDKKRTYPVAFLIHGGPQGSFGNEFHYRWNPQTYAGAGYAALMVDFHGSTGYGQAFTDAIRDDWGGRPLEDLQKGLDAALHQFPFLDGKRVAALGASYGGYMIYWIAGNWSDRFRCLVAHDGNIDERMAYFDTEELWFPEWEHRGTPWDNPTGYTKHNPIDHIGQWKTPMLIVHGGQDFRVADTQGLSAFTALQRRGIPSKLLYFPDENHWVQKPANSLEWHETVQAWLDQWTKR